MDVSHTNSSVHSVQNFEASIFSMQVGNALTDDFHDHFGLFQFMWSAGLISDQTYKQLNLLCDFQSFVHVSEQCDKILDIAYNEFGNIDPYSIFTPTCTANRSESNQILRRWHVSTQIIILECTISLYAFTYFYINDSPVKVHVHIISWLTESNYCWPVVS